MGLFPRFGSICGSVVPVPSSPPTALPSIPWKLLAPRCEVTRLSWNEAMGTLSPRPPAPGAQLAGTF